MNTHQYNTKFTFGVSVAVALLIIGAFWLAIMVPRIVYAFDLVYVAPGGGDACNGNSPCYDSIQEAVNNTDPGGSVLVFPGTYEESIDLTEMGSDLTEPAQGDISLLTVNADGEPTAGTATISITDEIAFEIDEDFAGNVMIDGFVITAAEDGIDLGDIEGDITLQNLTITDASDDGIRLEVAGSIAINNTTIANSGSEGIRAEVMMGDVMVFNVESNNNGSEGIQLDVISGTITTDRTITNGNADEGLDLLSTEAISATNATAIGNGDTGIEFDDSFIDNNNPQDSILGNGTGYLANAMAQDNDREAIRIDVLRDITVISATVETAGREGFRLAASGGGDINVSDVSSQDTLDRGHSFQLTGGNLTVTNATSINSDEVGFFVDMQEGGNATFTNTTATANSESGFEMFVNDGGNVTIDGALANQNGEIGFDIIVEQMGNISMSNAEAHENGDPASSSDEENPPNGFTLRTEEGNLQVTNASAFSNINEGFALTSSGSITVANVTAQNNNADGLSVLQEIFIGPIDNLTIANSIFENNGSDPERGGGGLTIAELDPNGVLEVIGNVIAGNATHGLSLDTVPDETVLTATGNWWGDTSGPSGIGSGFGDSIVVEEGSVTFTPWINTLNVTAEEALAQTDTTFTVLFQFTDSSGSVFLGEGPGDLNATTPPFTLTTNDGDVTTSGFIEGAEGTLSATVTTGLTAPEVHLAGPGGLRSPLSSTTTVYLPLINR